ncbi:hypothetical protein Y032_0309g2067 [Ancylostoma ceylanicum]|uniref:Uncharacterized protein n=1 Tax=Ancylostoma ceylanicum TaxID=53326 RepID=A0A016S2S7_9BILA|nr:hypothetical protein Y032_0309g2067 [Ancylostoma ceylanicum]
MPLHNCMTLCPPLGGDVVTYSSTTPLLTLALESTWNAAAGAPPLATATLGTDDCDDGVKRAWTFITVVGDRPSPTMSPQGAIRHLDYRANLRQAPALRAQQSR